MHASAKNPVVAYYDAEAQKEWNRLEECWIEFAVTLDRITSRLGTGERVLDLGGGPGRYALALTQRGHAVDLIDLSPAAIALAGEKAQEQQISLRRAAVGDARDLSEYGPNSFDAVLCLGPLYHLVDRRDRDRVRDEVARVLRPWGVAFFACLSTLAPMHFACKRPELFAELAPTATLAASQDEFRVEAGGAFFTEAVFLHPDGLDDEFSAPGLEVVEVFGAESLFAQSESALGKLAEGERDRVLEIARAHASSRAARYTSEHLVVVMQKP
ncbi:MAG: class I SAM-dependent methyltransferase [Pseudomonadota bacterium]